MIPPYFLTERLRLRLLPINWNATFCINYLIINLLEESKLENLPDSKSSNYFFCISILPLFFVYIYIYYIYN